MRLSRGAVTKKRVATERAPVVMQCVRDAGNALTFTLPEPPSANRWWRSVTIKTRRGVRHVVLLSKEARAYKEAVLNVGGSGAFVSDVALDITWYRGRKSGDLDKRLGVLCDALQGVAYLNDSQITQLTARRVDDPRNARVVVTVSPANHAALTPGEN